MFREDVVSKSATSNDLLFQGAVTNPGRVLGLKCSLDLASSWYFLNLLCWVFNLCHNRFIIRIFKIHPNFNNRLFIFLNSLPISPSAWSKTTKAIKDLVKLQCPHTCTSFCHRHLPAEELLSNSQSLSNLIFLDISVNNIHLSGFVYHEVEWYVKMPSMLLTT